MTEKTKKTLSTTLNIVEWVLIGLLAVFLVFVLVFASKKPGSDGKSGGSLFGYETRLVLSDSMNAKPEYYQSEDTKNYQFKNIQAGELIFLSDCDYQNQEKTKAFYNDLKVGDVVTYYSSNFKAYITHRVTNYTEVTEQDSQTHENVQVKYYTIKGDNVESEDFGIEIISDVSGLIVGKVVGHSVFLGWLYTNFLSNKVLIYIIVMVPTLIAIGYETYKIVKICNENKKEKVKAEIDIKNDEIKSKDDEIEELKRQLEEMKKNKNKDEK